MKAKQIGIIFIVLAALILFLTWIRVKNTDGDNNSNEDKDQKIQKLNDLINFQHDKIISLKRANHNLKIANKKGEVIEEHTNILPQKDGDDYLKDPQGRYVDFLISVRFIHCSVKLSVVRINAIFNPKRIIFMSYKKEDCVILRGFASNVHCIWEREILPTFSQDRFRQMVDEEIARKGGDKRLNKAEKSLPADIGSFKDRAGWFFLQMINLGAARYMKDLSENYVVWDSDIVPLSKKMKFFTNDGKIIRYTQRQHGDVVAIGYHKSYKGLTGRTMIHPGNKPTPGFAGTESWVSHQMVFTKSIVDEYLTEIENYRKVERDMWPEEIVKVAMTIKGHEEFGYADYDHYGSFSWEEHPEKFHVMMGSWAKFTRPTRPDNYKDGTCCIPRSVLEAETRRGSHYIVNEIHKGDVPICRSMNFYGLYHRDLPVSWLDDEDIMETLTTN